MHCLFGKKGFLVCFTGVDGSGKTTHAKSLIKSLEAQGYPCVYVWGACQPIFSYIFFVVSRLLGYWTKLEKDVYTDPLILAPKTVHDKFASLLRFFIFLDFLVKTLVLVQLPLFLGRIVTCDRYVYDLIMELIVWDLYSTRFGRFLVRIVPNPDVVFLTDVPENTATQRRRMSTAFFSIRRKVFLDLAQNFGFIVLDTSSSFEGNRRIVHEKTLYELRSHFG